MKFFLKVTGLSLWSLSRVSKSVSGLGTGPHISLQSSAVTTRLTTLSSSPAGAGNP